MTLCRVVGVWHCIGTHSMFRNPLMRSRRTFSKFPFVAKKIPEKVVAPFGRCGGPCTFQTTGDGMFSTTASKGIFPTKSLLFNASGSRFRSNIFTRIASPMGFAKSVSTGNKGDSFFVIHGHTRKSLANINGGCKRIRISVRPFGIHVDKSHLDCSKRIF